MAPRDVFAAPEEAWLVAPPPVTLIAEMKVVAMLLAFRPRAGAATLCIFVASSGANLYGVFRGYFAVARAIYRSAAQQDIPDRRKDILCILRLKRRVES